MTEVLVLQHEDCEPIGTIEDSLRAVGAGYQYIRGHAGEAVPEELGDAAGLIVMGGPMGAYEGERYPFLTQEMRLMEKALAQDLPMLGVCLGSQLLAAVVGANVRPGARSEIGWFPLTLTPEGLDDPLWRALPPQFTGFHWHGDMFDVPPGAVSLAYSEITPCQAFRYGSAAYGVQFHMEVTDAMVHDWIESFGGELTKSGADAVEILAGVPLYLPAMRQAARAFFDGWAEQLQGAR